MPKPISFTVNSPPKTIAVSVNSPEEFHKAQAALENAGILVSSINPGGAIGPIGLVHGFNNINGWLQIDASQAKRAEAILDELGIPNALNSRPIVDRSDPKCPACSAALDPAGDEMCPQCGRAFWWVDIDEPDLDPSGRECRNCGYDLTGNTVQRCPECSHPIVADSYDLFEAANADERPKDKPTPNQRFTIPATLIGKIGLGVMLTLIAALIGQAVVTEQLPWPYKTSDYHPEIVAVIVLFLLLAAVALSRFARRCRGR